MARPQTRMRTWRLGHSEQGRAIDAIEIGAPSAARKILVFGCIHGNECAGTAIIRQLRTVSPSGTPDLWLVPNLNPDGYPHRTRQNARGVDLNRNFPYGWLPIGRRGDTNYAGPKPLSEVESRIAYRLILRLRPNITIWFHQHMNIVDESGGVIAIERRYARLVGRPLRRLARYPGSVTTWQNHRFPGTTAFVVELPAGHLNIPQAQRYARAIFTIAR